MAWDRSSQDLERREFMHDYVHGCIIHFHTRSLTPYYYKVERRQRRRVAVYSRASPDGWSRPDEKDKFRHNARHFGPIFIQTVLWVFRGKLLIEMGFTVLAGPRLNSVCRVDFKFYLIY